MCVKHAAVLLTQVWCAAGGSIPQALFIRHLQWGAPPSMLVIVRAALGHLGGIDSPRVEGNLEEKIQSIIKTTHTHTHTRAHTHKM